MTLTVVHDVDTGLASLRPSLPLPTGQDLRFSLQDTRSRLYLTPSGWSATRKTLFQARLTDDNSTLVIDQAVTSLLTSGTPLLLEEIYVNYREAFVWPRVAPEPAIGPIVEAEKPPEPEANQPEPAVEPVTTEAADKPDEPPPVIAPSPTETQAKTEDSTGIRWRMWPAAALILLLCVPLAMWIFREGESKVAEMAAPSEQAKAVPAVNPPPPSPPPQRTDGANDAQTAEINRLKSEITALKDAAVQRNSELNLANIELTDLRKRAAEFDEQLRLARLTPTPTYKPSAELMAQVEQQKATIINLQKQLAQASSAVTPSVDSSTISLLRERNSELTRETGQQNATIVALRQDIEALKFKIQQQEARLAGRPAENVFEVVPGNAEPKTWLAAAVSNSGSVEVAVKQPSAQDALRAAVDLCAERGGRGCKALEAFPNGCVAVARVKNAPIQPGNFWYAHSRDVMDAQADAIDQCYYANEQRYRCDTAFVRCSY